MAGRISPFYEIRAVDDDGNVLPWDGESTGEIEMRGPCVAGEYYLDPEASAEKVREGGWLRTGDVGSIDHDGWLRITDRAKDVIKSGGEWISSVDLESALMAHPAVREAAVIARPDERWSERPLACVVARRGRRARRSSSCTSPAAWRSGGCRTTSPSSTRSRRRASASSTRSCCAAQLERGELELRPVERPSASAGR